MPDGGAVETHVIDVPGSSFYPDQQRMREQRDQQSEALADRHRLQSIDRQLEADLRVSLNMDSWPINLVFDIRIEDANGDYAYAPAYPEYDADQIFYYEYGDGSSFDGNHTLQKWMNRHRDDLERLGSIMRALETGVFA
jgi:hypothetical protein